jgi:hypothetical protein
MDLLQAARQGKFANDAELRYEIRKRVNEILIEGRNWAEEDLRDRLADLARTWLFDATTAHQEAHVDMEQEE